MAEPKIAFGTFEPKTEPNPYLDTIAQLIEAGENASITVTVDVADEGKERLKISKAANAKDKTARLRVRDDSKVKTTKGKDNEDVLSGTVALTYTLSKRHQARRGTSAEVTEEAAAE